MFHIVGKIKIFTQTYFIFFNFYTKNIQIKLIPVCEGKRVLDELQSFLEWLTQELQGVTSQCSSGWLLVTINPLTVSHQRQSCGRTSPQRIIAAQRQQETLLTLVWLLHLQLSLLLIKQPDAKVSAEWESLYIIANVALCVSAGWIKKQIKQKDVKRRGHPV